MNSEINNPSVMKESLHILHVEDSDDDIVLVREFISDKFELEHVTTLSDAIQRLSLPISNPDIDIILLDLGLPDSSGLNTLHDILQVTNGKPVVVLTTKDDTQTGLKAVRDGAEDYLSKNQIISPNYLNRSLAYAHERYHRMKQHEEVAKTNINLEGINEITFSAKSEPLSVRDSKKFAALANEYRQLLQSLIENSNIENEHTDSFIKAINDSLVSTGDLIDIHSTVLHDFPLINADKHSGPIRKSRELLLYFMSRIEIESID